MRKKINGIKNFRHGRLTIPGSKKITKRALIIAALSEGHSTLSNVFINNDIRTLIHCLHALGLSVDLNESNHVCTIQGVANKLPYKEYFLECGKTQSSAIFLLALCASIPGKFHFNIDEPLRYKSIGEFFKMIAGQGAIITPHLAENMPLVIEGADGLEGGEITIYDDDTGDLCSSMLLIAPFSNSPVLIENHQLIPTNHNIILTYQLMAQFNVLVKPIRQAHFAVPVPQRYACREYTMEADLALASYFFAAAAITSSTLVIQPFNKDKSKQPEVFFLTLLEKMGCEILSTETSFSIKGPEQLKGINIDMRSLPDPFPAVMIVGLFASTPTTLTNINRSLLQEYGKFYLLCSELKKFGARIDIGYDWIKIFPSSLISNPVDAHLDPDIAMTLAIVGLKMPEEGIEIDNVETVLEMYPKFFKMCEEL